MKDQQSFKLYGLTYEVDGKGFIQTFLEKSDDEMITLAEKWVENNPEITNCNLHLIGVLKDPIESKVLKSFKREEKNEKIDKI